MQQLWLDTVRDKSVEITTQSVHGGSAHFRVSGYNRQAHFDCAIRVFFGVNQSSGDPGGASETL